MFLNVITGMQGFDLVAFPRTNAFTKRVMIELFDPTKSDLGAIVAASHEAAHARDLAAGKLTRARHLYASATGGEAEASPVDYAADVGVVGRTQAKPSQMAWMITAAYVSIRPLSGCGSWARDMPPRSSLLMMAIGVMFPPLSARKIDGVVPREAYGVAVDLFNGFNGQDMRDRVVRFLGTAERQIPEGNRARWRGRMAAVIRAIYADEYKS